MFQRYLKPTTFNIEYTGPHADISPVALSDPSNQNKVLMNNAIGNLTWTGYNGNNQPVFTDGMGKVDQSNLPSYVDDVLEYANFASFPVTGETGKIYLDTSGVNQAYRWTGSQYFLITDLSNYYNKSQVDTKDTTLQTNITNEATTRATNDTNIQTQVTNNLNTFNSAFTVGTDTTLNKSIAGNNKNILALNDIASTNALIATYKSLAGNNMFDYFGGQIRLLTNVNGNGMNIGPLNDIISLHSYINNFRASGDGTLLFDTSTNLMRMQTNLNVNSKNITGVITLGAERIYSPASVQMMTFAFNRVDVLTTFRIKQQ